MGNPQIHSFLKKNIFCPSQKHKILGLIITLYIFLSRVEEGWITTVTAEFQRSSFAPPSYRHLTKNPQLLREWREISREQCSLPKTQSSKLTFLKSCLEKKKKKRTKNSSWFLFYSHWGHVFSSSRITIKSIHYVPLKAASGERSKSERKWKLTDFITFGVSPKDLRLI